MGERETRTTLEIPNGNFENGEAGWTIDKSRGECEVTSTHAASGKRSLRVFTTADLHGAKIEGPKVPCTGPGLVELYGKVLGFSGRLLGLWVREYDAAGMLLPSSQNNWGELGDTGGKWQEWLLTKQIVLDSKTVALQVFLMAYPTEHETIEVYLDDLRFERVEPPIPPYASQYKIRPDETAKLTAADVVGPDGVVYPDWTQVGVPGGIPDVAVAARLENYGVKPGDDITDALDRACREVGQKGGGAVKIGEGTFRLGRTVTIEHNGIVIRGAGRDKTRLVYDNPVGQPGKEIGFCWPKPSEPAGPDTVVEAHVYHSNIKHFRMLLNGREVPGVYSKLPYRNERLVTGEVLLELAGGPGEATLRVEAEYEDGHKDADERQLLLTRESQPVKAAASIGALLFFQGGGIEEREYTLARDGKRGDSVLEFEDASGLKVGDKIDLHAPGTQRFLEMTQHLSGGADWHRVHFLQIVKLEGNHATVNQPLRIDFPREDGTYARRLVPVERCGVEDLAIEHLSRLSVNSIDFDWAWTGWVRNVRVVNSGSCAAHGYRSKWLEFRGNEFDGAWNFDGGQAYGGFSSSQDCLYENNVVKGHRHAPVVQYGAMGNVFRNSVFDGSDLQWHAGWSTENLFENCVIRSRYGGGSYGNCAYATGSDDPGHGPNGPRNVVYNCDFTSTGGGVVLDGVNERWIFIHNRIAPEKGAGFVLRCGSFDHLIRGNTVVVKEDTEPLLQLRTPDCVGIELIDNTLIGGNGKLIGGNGKLTEGAAQPAMERGNHVLPALSAGEALPPRPVPAIPSIYAWQNRGQDGCADNEELAAGSDTSKTNTP